MADELLSRVRRIETRLTQAIIALGIDTQARKPLFSQLEDGSARIVLQSPHTSIKELLDNIPDTWDGPVRVQVGDKALMTLDKSRNPD